MCVVVGVRLVCKASTVVVEEARTGRRCGRSFVMVRHREQGWDQGGLYARELVKEEISSKGYMSTS